MKLNEYFILMKDVIPDASGHWDSSESNSI